MCRPDKILDNAWDRVSLNSRMKLPETINLLDQIEAIYGRPIISNEYRSFWIDTVLSNPGLFVSKSDFKELFRTLFDMNFEEAFQSTERNRDNLTKRMTDSILEETTNLNKLRYMDDTKKIDEYSKRIHLLRDALETRDSHGKSRYLDHSTEFSINQKLVKYLSALNAIYKHHLQTLSDRSPSQYVNKLSSGIAQQEDLLKTLSEKFSEREMTHKFGWIQIGKMHFGSVLLKLIIFVTVIMMTSYGLSLLAESDDGYASYYYYDNENQR